MSERHEIAIIGTGFSGLGMAIKLKQAGFEDFVLLERAEDLGGTWRDNHYPGLCCDIPSHVYSFSYELNTKWTRGFAPGWEILDYIRKTAEKHGIEPHIRYGHEALDAAWDEGAQRWEIETPKGTISARVLISGAGGLADPKEPEIPGLERFQGKTFHSASWDHDYDLNGKSVAVIGTGASAIQFVPQIQPQVASLDLYQRTPPWIVPRFDHEITRPEHWALRWIPFAPRIVRWALYGVMEVRIVGFRNPRIMRPVMWLARRNIRRQVRDPELADKVTPDYTLGCKRVLISDDYLPALAQPNVDVITDGIREVRENSVVSEDGTEREVDAIIFGTGFHVADPPIAQRLRGRGGHSLSEVWREEGMEAHRGTAIAGFPNFFILLGPNTGLGHNSVVIMIEAQVNYVIQALEQMRGRDAATIEVRREVQDAFNEGVQGAMEGTVWTAGHCNSWYLDRHGRNRTLWPGSTLSFRRRVRRFEPAEFEIAAPEPAEERVPVRG